MGENIVIMHLADYLENIPAFKTFKINQRADSQSILQQEN